MVVARVVDLVSIRVPGVRRAVRAAGESGNRRYWTAEIRLFGTAGLEGGADRVFVEPHHDMLVEADERPSTSRASAPGGSGTNRVAASDSGVGISSFASRISSSI